MHAAFDNSEAWSPMYQRNNKRTGLKNIRCFPYCSEQHIEKGFCGRPVVLRVARSYRDQSPPIFAWGEFRRVDDPRDIEVGTVVPGELIRSRTKDPKSAKTETLNAPYFEGMVEGGEKCRASPLVKFVFNQRKKGWNYAWQASKHTAKARHAFFAYLFVQSGEDELKCLSIHVSPTFILYCRKRKGEGMPSRMGRGAGEDDFDDDDFDDDDDGDDDGELAAPTQSGRKKASPSSRRKRALSAAISSGRGGGAAASSAGDRKMPHLEPIVSPAKFPTIGPPSVSSSFLGGGLTPTTALYLSIWGSDEPTPSGNRTTATGTPSSSWSGDSDDIDFEAANQLDPAVISRVATVLNRIHDILTKDGTAESMGMPQFALDWFLNDLEEFTDVEWATLSGDAQTNQPPSSSSSSLVMPAPFISTPRLMVDGFNTPRELEPLDWGGSKSKDVLQELAEYLLEESSLSASIRQILAQAEDGKLTTDARVRAFIRLFSNEISNFLARRAYTEKELDDFLASRPSPKPDEATKALETLSEHVQHVVESQKRLDNVKTNPPRTWMRAISVRPEIDLSGYWRLDDSLLKAFDECRAKRGVPFMMRKLLSYMETRIRITHTSERVVIGLKSKLFASAEVAYELDNVERVWDVAPPVPWPTKLCETYKAWIDGDILRYCHTYNGTSRTDRFVRKNVTGDRLEMDVYYQESDSGSGIWKTILFRRGYALKITAVDY